MQHREIIPVLNGWETKPPDSARILCSRCPKVGRTGTLQNLKESPGGYCTECRREYQKERSAKVRAELKANKAALAHEMEKRELYESAYAYNTWIDRMWDADIPLLSGESLPTGWDRTPDKDVVVDPQGYQHSVKGMKRELWNTHHQGFRKANNMD